MSTTPRFLIKALLTCSSAFIIPAVVFAATPRTFAELIYFFVDIINLIVPILASLALLIFFWGIFQYIANSADSEAHERGRRIIIWGTIGLFVLFSLWGILRILQNTFLTGATAGQSIPDTAYPHEPVAPIGLGATVES